MRILIVGDSYCPSSLLRPPFEALGPGHQIEAADVVDAPEWLPTTGSEGKIKEYLGTPSQVIDRLAGHEVLVVQGAPVTDAVLDAAPLRLVCVARGGPVNVDVAAATERGIPVVTTPGKNAEAVAELTIAFLVMLARRIPAAMRFVDAGNEYGVDNYEGSHWFGHDLAGHTLGLVGLGQVGRKVASRAHAFGIRVVAYDPYVSEASVREVGVEPVSLEALLAESDHVSLHARLTPDNRGFFDTRIFSAMRSGATLVNTARHELIDEPALIDALASGRLSGAALDVATPSQQGERHPLLRFANVFLVPHVGGATFETLLHGGQMAADEVARFARGEPLANLANRAGLAAAPATHR